MSFLRLAPEQADTLEEIPAPAENPLLAGHGEAADMLAAEYRAGRLHHALLLAGPPGIGKATLAFHLAHHLLAHPETAEAPARLAAPDPASALFRQIAQGAHPGVLHLTRPVNERTKAFKTVVTVDEIRKVARFLSMTSHDGGYRIVIVDPADDMNASAANALLKNLEEPPARVLFVLIAHSPGRLLPTIRSRCRLVRLKPLEPPQLLSVLEALGADPGDAAAREEIVRRAGGSVREAILLSRHGGLDISREVARIVSEPVFDVAGAWRVAEAVSARGADMHHRIFLDACLDLVAARAGAAAAAGELAHAAALSELWSELRALTAEAEAYNLDRRQQAMEMLRRMHGSGTGAGTGG